MSLHARRRRQIRFNPRFFEQRSAPVAPGPGGLAVRQRDGLAGRSLVRAGVRSGPRRALRTGTPCPASTTRSPTWPASTTRESPTTAACRPVLARGTTSSTRSSGRHSRARSRRCTHGSLRPCSRASSRVRGRCPPRAPASTTRSPCSTKGARSCWGTGDGRAPCCSVMRSTRGWCSGCGHGPRPRCGPRCPKADSTLRLRIARTDDAIAARLAAGPLAPDELVRFTLPAACSTDDGAARSTALG